MLRDEVEEHIPQEYALYWRQGKMVGVPSTYGKVNVTVDLRKPHLDEKLALKRINCAISQRKMIYREMAIIRALQSAPHRNILAAYNVLPESQFKVGLLSELIPQSLRIFTDQMKVAGFPLLPMPIVRDLLKGILSALKHLESFCVLHRDIKPDNILVRIVGSQVDPRFGELPVVDAVLCDFGSAKFATPTYEFDASRPNTPRGIQTACWRAPEVFMQSSRYGFPVDMWGAGCIFAEMLIGRVLFNSACQGDSRNPPNDLDHLMRIFHLLGMPTTTEVWEHLTYGSKGFPFLTQVEPGEDCIYGAIAKLPKFRGYGLQNMCDGKALTRAGELGIDLLSKMLALSPRHRIRPSDALEHPFFQLPVESLSADVSPISEEFFAYCRISRDKGVLS
jgi:serine/threonine protein kinase